MPCSRLGRFGYLTNENLGLATQEERSITHTEEAAKTSEGDNLSEDKLGMADSETTSPTVTASELALLSGLDELRTAWEESQPKRAEGGLLALSGFEHQFLLTLLKIVREWKKSSEAERQDPNTAYRVLTEAISDITESGTVVRLTQVKRTLSETLVREALEELWEIFKLASERTPGLVEHLRFVISGKFEGGRNPDEVIRGWGARSKRDQTQKLAAFKARVSYEFVADPKTDLTAELENLSRDEDTQTTIGRWSGYLLQLGSGVPPERISALIWRELRHDKSLEAFRATLARLFSQSRYRLRAVRHTLSGSLSLPRTDTLLQLQASVLAKSITLLIGSSGSGKSALCKLGMQTSFQEHTCLFLHASDVVSFTEAPDSTSTRDTRRLDELLAALLSLAVAWLSVLSKFLTKLLQRSIQAFERSMTHRVATTTNPVFPSAAFSAFVGLGAFSNRILVMIWG
jgi:hypothetical protein